MLPKARNIKFMSEAKKSALKEKLKDLYPNLSFDKLFN